MFVILILILIRIVDNIPAARKMKTEEGEILYSEGFELGLIDVNINNFFFFNFYIIYIDI